MVNDGAINPTWDNYFFELCKAVASKSPCLSRKIGAILVKDKSIVSTGYNGPPRGVPHCQDICPRKVMGFESGKGMEWCPAQHAEENAVSNAARLGVSVLGSTLYMNSVIPCQKCFGTLINAGITDIVIDNNDLYDEHTAFLIKHSDIIIRRFEL